MLVPSFMNEKINTLFFLSCRFVNASEITNIVQEGRKIRLYVVRTKGTIRVVTIYWKITPVAGNDIMPGNGSLIFPEVISILIYSFLHFKRG